MCTGNLPTLVIISSSLALLDGNESNQIKSNHITSHHITSMKYYNATQRNPNLSSTPNILLSI